MGATGIFTAVTSGAQIAGAGISAYGALQQSKLEQQGYEYNAALADLQAKEAVQAGEITQEEITSQEDYLKGEQEAAYAKSGVTMSGSPLDVMLQSATNFEFDKSIERYNTAVQVSRDQSQAQLDRFYGKQARSAGKVKALTTLLGAAPKISNAVGTIKNLSFP